MQALNPPSRLSEGLFRVYEPWLRQAVERFPTETEVRSEYFVDAQGKPLSGNTFVARFRDAVVSLLLYKWETVVDVAKLRDIRSSFVITRDLSTGSVWFREKQRRGRPPQILADYIVDERPAAPAGSSTLWVGVSIEEVTALCVLLHSSRLVGPFLVHGELPYGDDLETKFNVAVVYDAASNKTIIT